MKVVITRNPSDDKQTIGKMVMYDSKGNTLYECFSMELAWKDNEIGKSCIPTGKYKVIPWISPSKGKCLKVLGTEPRTHILFHSANHHFQLQGCIAPGNGLADINKDGYVDVINSRAAMRELMRLAPEGFELVIV